MHENQIFLQKGEPLAKVSYLLFLSFLRKQESSEVKGFWTPASAGVTAFI